MELRGANIGQPRKARVPNPKQDPNQINVATPTYTESELQAMLKSELIALILAN